MKFWLIITIMKRRRRLIFLPSKKLLAPFLNLLAALGWKPCSSVKYKV